MKKISSNVQSGFIIPLIIAIIAVLAIGGGVYVYHQKKVEEVATASSTAELNTAETASTSAALSATTSDMVIVPKTSVVASSSAKVKVSIPVPVITSPSVSTNTNVAWNVYHDPAGFAFNYPSTWTIKSDTAITGGKETTLFDNGAVEVKIDAFAAEQTSAGALLQNCSTGGITQVMANNTYSVQNVSGGMTFCMTKGETRYVLTNLGSSLLNDQIISSLQVNS